MPYGPKGQWRPAGDRACSVHVAKIATGEIEETFAPPRRADGDYPAASRQAAKGAEARAEKLSPERRREIAKMGAQARWRS